LDKRLLILLVCCFSVGLQAQAWAEDSSFKKNQYYRGITAHHKVTHVAHADVDGDGSDETIVCYREPEEALDRQGGVLILTKFGSRTVVAWHAIFEKMFPKQVTAKGKELTFQLLRTGLSQDKKFEKALVLGKDFHFRSQEGNPFEKVEIEASSTLKKEGVAPENVFDRRLKTGWAEGADGTGVDQTISLTFSKPVSLGLVGILHGNFSGRQQWRDNNRLHRAEVTVETAADRFDDQAEIEEDLGLGLYGDRVELSFTNRPVIRYFKLGKKGVISIELKITSVLLGEKNDDTYVAEIDLVELIPLSVTTGVSDAGKDDKSKKSEDTSSDDADADDWTEDDF